MLFSNHLVNIAYIHEEGTAMAQIRIHVLHCGKIGVAPNLPASTQWRWPAKADARRLCAATTQMSRCKPSNFRIDAFIFSNARFILFFWILGLTSAENCVILRSFPPETVIFNERRRVVL